MNSSTRKARLLFRYLLLLPVIAFVGGCTSSPDKPVGSADLALCGPLPNCVNSASGQGAQAVDPIQADDAQWQQLKTWIAQQPDWEIVVDDSHFIQAVARTPLMRFRDDVQLQFKPKAGLIHVRSSSRLGISDLGANRKRVEVLRAVVDPAAAGERSSMYDY